MFGTSQASHSPVGVAASAAASPGGVGTSPGGADTSAAASPGGVEAIAGRLSTVGELAYLSRYWCFLAFMASTESFPFAYAFAYSHT